MFLSQLAHMQREQMIGDSLKNDTIAFLKKVVRLREITGLVPST